MRAPCALIQPGLVPYEVAEEVQRLLAGARSRGEIPDVLLLLEHPPVFTLGRRADRGHVLWDAQTRRLRGVGLHATDRGGDVTYHGPGQLVGYPILYLGQPRPDVHRYLRDLEEVLLRALADFGLRAGRERGLTGVWARGAKVAAIGIKVARRVTRHGFALNVDPDLTHFTGIVPCGLEERPVSSLRALLGRPLSLAEVAARVAYHFGEVFERRLVPATLEGILARAGAAAGVT